jgi:hypothetical protein
LDEVEASGGFWDWGSAHHWLSSITDEAICKEQGLTCGDNDQVCGSENWQFIKGVTSEDECWQIAQNKNTN